jgi:hypothetical protein
LPPSTVAIGRCSVSQANACGRRVKTSSRTAATERTDAYSSEMRVAGQ